MFTPVNYDFSANMQLSDYRLEASTEFPFKSIYFDGNVLKLIALVSSDGELMIKTDAENMDVSLKLKVKSSNGNASSNIHKLISDTYIETSTMACGIVTIHVKRGESFEFKGYSLVAK